LKNADENTFDLWHFIKTKLSKIIEP